MFEYTDPYGDHLTVYGMCDDDGRPVTDITTAA